MTFISQNKADETGLRLVGPLYLQVANHLRRRIVDGEWGPNVALPNEGDLSLHYQISLGTMRKALEHLVRSNMLVRYQGRGTFVRARSGQDPCNWLSLATDAKNEAGPATTTVLSTASTTANLAESTLLQVPLGSKLEKLICLTRNQQGTVSYDTIILPTALLQASIGAIDIRPGAFPEALMPLMSSITRCNDRIAVAPAANEEAAALGLKAGDTVLTIERQTVDRNNRTPLLIRRVTAGSMPLVYSLSA